MGRFLSRDTWALDTWNPVEVNRYGYAAGNPVNWGDPSGHMAEYFPMTTQIGTTDILILAGLGITVATLLIWTTWQYADIDFVAMAEALQVEVMHLAKKLPTTDGKKVRVRPLSDKEVRQKGLHQEKQKTGARGDDVIYVDGDGNLYIGPKGGPIEPLGHVDDY